MRRARAPPLAALAGLALLALTSTAVAAGAVDTGHQVGGGKAYFSRKVPPFRIGDAEARAPFFLSSYLLNSTS